VPVGGWASAASVSQSECHRKRLSAIRPSSSVTTQRCLAQSCQYVDLLGPREAEKNGFGMPVRHPKRSRARARCAMRSEAEQGHGAPSEAKQSKGTVRHPKRSRARAQCAIRSEAEHGHSVPSEAKQSTGTVRTGSDARARRKSVTSKKCLARPAYVDMS
jgi:hypothetical protein